VKGDPCAYEGCGKPRVAHGLCMGHYRQQLRGTPLRPLGLPRGRNASGRAGPRKPRPRCTFEGCGRPRNGKGLCAAHRAQKAQGRRLVPIGAAKRWWWPVEVSPYLSERGGMPTEGLKRGA
jgi:hypothetical protein